MKLSVQKLRRRWRFWWHTHFCQICVDSAVGGGLTHVMPSWNEVGFPAKLFACRWRNWGIRNFPAQHPGFTRREQKARRRAWVLARRLEDKLGLPTYTLEECPLMQDGDRMTVRNQGDRLWAERIYHV